MKKSSQPIPVFARADIEENRFIAAIAYLNILFLVPLLLKKDSAFAQFHAKQGLYFFVVFLIGPLVFWFPIIGWLLGIYFVCIAIYAFVQALLGRAWRAPGAQWFLELLNL